MEVTKIFGDHLIDPNILKKYPIVINAGVHEGQEMIDLISLVPEVTIYALEPSNKCYNTIQNNFSTYNNINLIKKALVSSQRKIESIEFTDFVQNGREYTYGGLSEFSEFRSSGYSYKVETTNLKKLLKTINSDIGFLKADIEGAEYEIIMDLDADMASKIKQIAIEVQDIPGKSYYQCKLDMIEKLETLGYEVYTHNNGDFTNDVETETINNTPFVTGGLYAYKKK